MCIDNVIPKLKGSWAEHRARAWLLEQGYEIFPNGCAHGDTDIVAIKDGEFFRFDVKLSSSKMPKLTKAQQGQNIKLLFVTSDGMCSLNWADVSQEALKYKKQWREQNPEYDKRGKERKKQWRAQNQGHIKAYNKQWREQNPEYSKQWHARKKAEREQQSINTEQSMTQDTHDHPQQKELRVQHSVLVGSLFG